MLRIYTVVFACWLGCVALLALAAMMRPQSSWYTTTVVVTIEIGAFIMNIANPEHIVAEHNISRAATSGTLDVDYLSSLSLDAAPAIFSRIDEIDAVTDPGSDRAPTQDRDATDLV